MCASLHPLGVGPQLNFGVPVQAVERWLGPGDPQVSTIGKSPNPALTESRLSYASTLLALGREPTVKAYGDMVAGP